MYKPTNREQNIRNKCNSKQIYLTMIFSNKYYFRIESFTKGANYISSNDNIYFERNEGDKAYKAMFDKAEEIYNKVTSYVA